jgi:translation initiation factor 3 subunit G
MDDESAATNSRAERLGINKDGDAKAPSTGGRYVPKFRQDGGGERFKSGYDRSDRDQEHVLKVQNLTQEAVEDDIRDLFSNFARPSYIKLVRDRNTQESRGLAFVKFTRKSDAQLCLDNLNGHPYGNQILMVEWSQQWQPRVSTTASILKSQKRRF